MSIPGTENLSVAQLRDEIQRGGRFVVFDYCFSLVLVSFKRSSRVHFFRAGQSRAGAAFKYTLISLCFGWWGIPWGIIYTIASVFTNLGGGRNVTNEVVAALDLPDEPSALPAHAAPPPHGAYGGASAYAAPTSHGVAPGAQVTVQWTDGQRYSAVVVQATPHQCLVSFPNGQQQWVPTSNVAAG